MYLISIYNYRGDLISETEATGTREEVKAAAADYCRKHGAVFYYVQELENGGIKCGGFEHAETV